MSASRPYIYLAFVIAAWACSGCDRSPALPPAAAAYAAELTAAAAAADVPFTVPAAPQREPLRYPHGREITTAIAADSLNLIEFLRLARCDLNRVIAAHNSLLSRVQDQVEPLFYAAEFVAVAERCLEGGEGSALKRKLAAVRRQKRQAMPQYTYNAVFTTREVRQLFSPYAQLSDFAALSTAPPGAAIAQLRELATQLPKAPPNYDFESARSRFDLALGQLGERRLGGAVVFYGHWLLRLSDAGSALATQLAAAGRCDLLHRLRASREAFTGEIARLQTGAALVAELLELAPADAPVDQAYLQPQWLPLVERLRIVGPATGPGC